MWDLILITKNFDLPLDTRVPASLARPLLTRLLSEQDVAQQLSISVAALRKWRLMGRGPRYRKLGSLVRYDQRDVQAWREACPVGGTTQDGGVH